MTNKKRKLMKQKKLLPQRLKLEQLLVLMALTNKHARELAEKAGNIELEKRRLLATSNITPISQREIVAKLQIVANGYYKEIKYILDIHELLRQKARTRTR